MGRGAAADRGQLHARGVGEQPLAAAGDDCFVPRRRGPLPRGASRADVERAFPGWEITDVEVADTEPDPIARLFKFEESFYRLRRDGSTH